eukprot:CAMPEP_0176159100 /NCGR_PEP_ID=MMETSP0120_2-20121206/81384_1 /TAXON_ID=160619 /ORGANISM="Kryptoperidinium foliaceum, Strain CCMP 1326" /LENGTH=628 /DNA_ID=CAMNT_0017496501 /DNA_START=165 /DNA_END=2051 /DNA_ORIENTATION=-
MNQLSKLLLLGALLTGSTDAAWIVKSEKDNAWATGLGRFDALRRIFTVSTDYFDGSNQLTEAGNLDTDCYFLVADGEGHWQEIPFEHPNLCVGGATAFQGGDGTAFFMGLDGNQTMLRSVGGLSADVPYPGTFHALPPGKIPVAIAPGDPEAEDFVYIALHDITGDREIGFGKNRADNLVNMMAFWRRYTVPQYIPHQKHVPHIIKIDPVTGNVAWLGIYSTEGTTGNALISSMKYHGDSLIVVGSTNGSGEFYGTAKDNTYDAFVGFVDKVTGNPDTLFVDPETSFSVEQPAIRISSNGMGGSGGNGADDYGEDMCVSGNDLFVVGTTQGRMDDATESGGAFVVRIDLKSRTIKDKKQFPGKTRTGQKILCTDSHIYFAGQINYPGQSKPQDMYVAAYEHDLETLYWATTIDSSPYFEETRRDQLVAIEMNPALDVNILWNSQVLENGISHTVFMDLQGDSGANEIQKGISGTDGGIPDGGLEGVEPIVDNSGGNQGSNNGGSSGGSDQGSGGSSGGISQGSGGDSGGSSQGSGGNSGGSNQGSNSGGSSGGNNFGNNEVDEDQDVFNKIKKAEADRERKQNLAIGLGIGLPVACLLFVCIVHTLIYRKEKAQDVPPEMSPADAPVV